MKLRGLKRSGGFSCVLGNPPWERIKLQEQEFFAQRDETIANAPNAAARKIGDAQGTRAVLARGERAMRVGGLRLP